VFSHAIYNAYIHPLSSFPGPKLWSTTYLFRHISNMCGQLDWDIMAMHEKYGGVIRFSPSELSFISEQSWKDIYASKEVPLMKDPEWYGIVKLGSDGAPSIFTASPDNHPRIRKHLIPAFSEKALREQEPSIQSYVDLFIEKMKAIATSSQPADMVKWYNFTTFDLIGDLAIGKSFSCLNESNYHSWVSNIFKSIQIGPYIRTMATYTDIERLMRLLAPKAVKAARAKHEQYVQVHTQERIDQGVCEERRDFISYFLRTRDSDKTSFTDNEIAANTGFIILAGSETTATALSGTSYYLLMNPQALARATTEVRNAFLSEADITFAQTAASLPYITACLTEGLRLYPPGPGGAPRRTPRELNARVATIAGYKIPPNVRSLLPPPFCSSLA
jgi:cytochrome P450